MSVYGPVTWYMRAKQAFHADAGRNVPTGVTLTAVDSSVVELEASGARTTVATITVGDTTIVDGALSGVTDAGVDYTLVAAGAGPTISALVTGDYYVVHTATRSDGTKEVLEQPLTVKA